MYLDYFKLNEAPFELVSDPRFLYLSPNHAKVKSYLQFALNVRDSFVVITGEIGSGKTTLINDALESFSKSQKVLINIQALDYSSEEFLQAILIEMGIKPYEFSKMQMLEQIKNTLINYHRSGRKAYLIIDEAQNLSQSLLNDVRYLSDLELKNDKLLSVVMVGQPELNAKIDLPEMEHFLQRVRLRTHLKALDVTEIQRYIKHRLTVAGAKLTDIFEDESFEALYVFTNGRLRLINNLCDYALMYCSVEKLGKITPMVIQKAAQELQWEPYEARFGQYKDDTQFRNGASNKPEKAKLIVSQQGRVVGEFILNKDSLAIGRHKSNDVSLDSHKVSRKHAQVVSQNGKYYLHDLNSTNGTFINGEKVSVRQLIDGLVFKIDQFYLNFEDVVQAKDNSAISQVVDITRGKPRDDTRILPGKQPTVPLTRGDLIV